MKHRPTVPTANYDRAGAPRATSTRKRRSAALVAASALGWILSAGATAIPAVASTAGAERLNAVFQVTLSGPQPHWSRIVATGTFNDSGTIQFGEDRDGIHYDTLLFSQGAVIFASPEASIVDHFSFNPMTCVGTDVQTGTATMTGTGRYAGLSGEQTWTNRATIVARWAPGCSPDEAVGYVVFTSAGTASLR